MKFYCFTITCAIAFFSLTVNGQIVINEILASNSSINQDPDYSEYSDWVELYNSGSSTIDLSEYTLTDNFKDLVKWKFPSGTQIGSKSFLLIWTDGKNTKLHTSFKLSADGEELALIDASGKFIDSVSFGLQDPNISLGRNNTNNAKWGFFTKPTPGTANSTTQFDGIVKNSPDFSISGGVFNTTISLNLRTLYEGTVRYTLDGSEPSETSPVASSAINIIKNTVVRARIYKTNQVPGPVVTNSYFIDLNNELSDLPIVSISTAPANFWDPAKGIYVQDFKPDWEVPVNIELFEKDSRDKAAFNAQAGIKINGLYSWQLPQKMLGVYFRKEYGTSKLEYPIIFDKSRKVYDDFALRASGNDWSNTLFRDGMAQNSTMEYTDLDNSGFRACVVYVNGEFLGIHNIREKIDEDYIVGNHGLEPGTFDMVENTDFAETGDLAAYNQLLALTAKDLTNQANWDAVAEQMDIANFTDLICTEVYDGNSSIDHNVMAWKPKDTGKWKWIIMDLDRGFFNINSQLIDFYVKQTPWPLGKLMNNQDYRTYLGKKLADHLFTTFNPERIKARIAKHASAIEADIPAHIKRWEGTSSSYGDPIPSVEYWLAEVEKLKTFAEARPNVILNDLTNYGFQSPVPVSITTSPAKAGTLTFNGMKIPVDVCNGGYPKGEEIKLIAEAKAGYEFKGWLSISDSVLIAREQVWKYSDAGTDLGTSWKNPDFSDSSWKSGQAELGYGDGDEKTVISYGNNSSDKYITSYFRKTFVLNNKGKVTSLTMSLKCDDGAVVYLNGNEIHRYNMPSGTISFGTTASSSISGADESDFHTYSIDAGFLVTGNNTVAVEVHQNSASSSDVSFDLQLSAQMTGSGQYLSTSKEFTVVPQAALNITAVFESDGKCILPSEITSELTLDKDCSPYVASNDVNITSTGKLNIPKGVEIWMSDGASIYSEGVINAIGTKAEPVIFRGNPEMSNKEWGFISISNVNDTSRFINVIIEDASRGERPREVGAITAYKSVVQFDSIHFDNIAANPIATRFCKVRLTNSLLHSNITGDLINITRGTGYIANCEFIGNTLPDNDAIDFNGGANSIVKNCIIRDYFGTNSDAIDLGEKATNIRLEGLYVHDITDKGVSVGQQSKASISNSLFTNCNLGAGIKDSSYAEIDHCTYYGVGTPVATYEKIVGRAGGNVKVTNSILSNAYAASYLCDKYSTIDISYSASDNDSLPEGKHNLFVNPQLNNPTQFDFSLKANSPCINTGSDGNMGSGLTDTGIEPEIMISDIAYYTEPNIENLEFIGIYNPGDSRVNLGGYQVIKGFLFTFPDWVSIAPKEKIFITSNAASSFWDGRGATVFQWESGKLADEGEDIQLINEVTTMIDEVSYNNKAPWPIPTNPNEAITLSYFDVDNHFGENWEIQTPDKIVGINNKTDEEVLKVYPNPTSGMIYISGAELKNKTVEIYNIVGRNVYKEKLNNNNPSIDLSDLQQGVYLLKTGTLTQRIILTK
jgi:hypothetical protein